MELTRQPRARCARFPEKHLFIKARYVFGRWQTPVVGLVTPENRLMGREANPKTPRKHLHASSNPTENAGESRGASMMLGSVSARSWDETDTSGP